MMELRCAIVFTVVGLVTATPHGYGVKGGSSAKAASGAAAGALSGIGELPVAVPLGAGFSGSFSKSSSSSYSSASSSSSSFSFSGSGAGGNAGLGSNGVSGCNTGNCHNAGSSGLSSAIDSSGEGAYVSGYTAANAAPAAGAAAAGQGIECLGPSCPDNSGKCASGQCQSKTGSDAYPGNSGPKCTSGQCGADVEIGGSLAVHGSNDIQIVPDNSKHVDNTKKQTAAYDKGSYDSMGSGCSSGNCGPSVPTSTKPNLSSYDSANDSDAVHSSGYGKNTGYQVPASQYDTGSGCTGGNSGTCGPSAPSNKKPGFVYGSSSSYDSASASDNTHAKNAEYQAPAVQYNTKDLSSDHDKPSYGNTGPGCSGGSSGGCGPSASSNTKPGFVQGSSNSYDSASASDTTHANDFGKNTEYPAPAVQYNTKDLSANNYKPSYGNTGPGCSSGSSGGCGPPASSNTKPGFVQGSSNSYDSASASDTTHANDFGKNAEYPAPAVQYNTKDLSANNYKPSYGNTGPGCSGGSSGGCGPSAPSNAKPSYVHGPLSLYDSASASDTTHTTGFGKNGDYQASAAQHSTKDLSSNPDKPFYGDTGSGCSGGISGSCGPTAPANTGYQEPAASHDTKGLIANHNTPSYVGSGPGCSNGGTGGCRLPVPANTKPGYVHRVSSSDSGASGSGTLQVTGFGINTGYQTPASHLETPKLDSTCNTQNCNPSYNPSLPSSYNVPIHGSYDYNSNPDKPCDGPKCATQPKGSYTSGGIVASNYLSPQHLPSIEKKEPTYSSFENCQGSNCGLGTSSPSSNPSSYQPSNSNKKLPPYTSGFGGPSGMLKPNDDYHAPATNFPSHTSSSAQAPVGKPSGCKSPDCKDYPAAGVVPAPGYSHSNNPVIPSKVTTPIYTGSLSVPVTASKPDVFDGHSSSSNYGHASSGTSQEASSFGSYPTGCATSKCIQPSGIHTSSGSIPNSSVSHPGHTIGLSSPSGASTGFSSIIPQSPVGVSTGSYSAGCTTPNCQISPTNNVQSESIDLSNANQYKPEGSYGAHGNPSICKNANCGDLPTGTSGVVPGIGAHAGSSAHPKPSNDASKEKLPPYTGGFGGPSGVLAPNKGTISGSHEYITSPATGIAQPVPCSSGNCNSKPSHVVTPSLISSSSGALAVATADASAVAYTGGFGGPPGLLKPYDDYKLDLSSSLGGATYNPSGNVNSHHETHVGSIAAQKVGSSSHEGSIASAGLQTGGLAGSASFSGAAANSGSLGWSGSGGYNKGISPCGGGCSGSSGSDGNSGHGYGTKTGATKSLSGGNAYGLSGGFASSSASAHASSGAYTKGGYGRR